MKKLPRFLRESHRFQDRFEGFDVDSYLDEYGDQNEYCTWRETELSTTSLATLLETKGAAEALFKFLDGIYSTHIAWISSDSFLSNDGHLHLPEATVEHLNLLFHVEYGTTSGLFDTVFFYRIVSTTPVTAMPIVSEEVGAVLRILAKDKNVRRVEWSIDQLPPTEPFPASLEALKAFVGEAQSPRLINFDLPSLSVEQWQVITSSCNQSVGLLFSKDDWQKGGFPLINAMKLNQCPTRLIICDGYFEGMSKATIAAFLSALEANTSLTNLALSLLNVSSEDLALLFGAISRNRGLRKLELEDIENMSDSEYELLCRVAFASHPTLRAISLDAEQCSSEARDQILVRAMRSNTVLQELDYKDAVHNEGAVEEQVRPILELNRFRPVVQSINKERDGTLRERMFATTLLSDQVCDNPASRYLLLNENADLLLQFLGLEDVLHQQRYRSANRLVSVEQRMRDAGMVPPSYESYFSCGKRKRS